MKLAVLSDIHANFAALCAALINVEKRGVDRCVFAGDLIGRGPHPVEVIRLLNQHGGTAIQGNMERKLLLLKGKVKDKKAARFKAHFRWTAQQLKKTEWEYLASLPEELKLNIQGYELLIVHGSPVSDKDSIYPSITSQGLKSKLGERHPHILICGHTHIPFSKRVSGMLVVNTGAVGTSIDGDPRGSYGIINFEEGSLPRAAIVRFAYDYKNVADDIERRRVPGVNPDLFRRGGQGNG